MKINFLHRVLTVILSIVMLSAMLVGCANGEGITTLPETTETLATPDITNPVETRFDPFAHIAGIDVSDYNGTDFTILNGCTASWFTRNSVISDSLDGDSIESAICIRGDRVKQKLGVEVKEISTTSVGDDTRNAINSGDVYFDVTMITLMSIFPIVEENILYNYNKLESINLSNPWWDQNAINDLTVIDNGLYFCTGSFDITRFDSIRCLAFNKDMIDVLNLESPYDLVENGGWTIDKFIELATDAKVDYAGDGLYTENDTYGLVSYNEIIADMLFAGSGIKYITKNADNELIIDINMDKLSVLYEKVRSIIHDPALTFDTKDPSKSDYKRGLGDRAQEQLFIEGKALFYSECLANVRHFRGSNISYGFVPPPKYDTEQEKYYSIMLNPFMYAFPNTTAEKAERSAFILDALMAASHDTVVPAYYDITLIGKIAQDPESVKMLGMVFDSLSYNLHFSSANMRSTIVTAALNNTANIAGVIKTKLKMIQNMLKKDNDALANLKNK